MSGDQFVEYLKQDEKERLEREKIERQVEREPTRAYTYTYKL